MFRTSMVSCLPLAQLGMAGSSHTDKCSGYYSRRLAGGITLPTSRKACLLLRTYLSLKRFKYGSGTIDPLFMLSVSDKCTLSLYTGDLVAGLLCLHAESCLPQEEHATVLFVIDGLLISRRGLRGSQDLVMAGEQYTQSLIS